MVLLPLGGQFVSLLASHGVLVEENDPKSLVFVQTRSGKFSLPSQLTSLDPPDASSGADVDQNGARHIITAAAKSSSPARSALLKAFLQLGLPAEPLFSEFLDKSGVPPPLVT